ncbi:MAG: hypothetical protein KatS3mg076_1780 [Candidatus Binatia bacterium]|nr:MAG: hypothetical protein KatS3mg076_1780 [Candidatus Binatia bacterium]
MKLHWLDFLEFWRPVLGLPSVLDPVVAAFGVLLGAFLFGTSALSFALFAASSLALYLLLREVFGLRVELSPMA